MPRLQATILKPKACTCTPQPPNRPRTVGNRGGLKGTARATTSVGYLLLTEELSRRTSSLADQPGRAVYPLCAPPQTGSYRGLRGDAFGGRAIGRQHGWLGGHYNHILGLSAMDRRVIETNAKPKGSTRQRRLPPCAPRAGGQGVTNVEWRSAFGQQEWPGWHYSHILGL